MCTLRVLISGYIILAQTENLIDSENQYRQLVDTQSYAVIKRNSCSIIKLQPYPFVLFVPCDLALDSGPVIPVHVSANHICCVLSEEAIQHRPSLIKNTCSAVKSAREPEEGRRGQPDSIRP